MVYIDHLNRIIVIENPKSGSTTLIKCLELILGLSISRKTPNHIIHTTSEDAQKMYGAYWKDYLKISTYRDPFNRFVSSSLMRAFIARYDISHIEHGTPINLNKLKDYFKKYKNSDCFCKSQELYTSGMDVLIRVDNFQVDIDKLCDLLGKSKIVVPHLNMRKPSLEIIDIVKLKQIYNSVYPNTPTIE